MLVAQFVDVRRRMAGRGDVDDAVAFVVALDVVALDRPLDVVQVLQPEILEQVDLVGVTVDAVEHAVGEARFHEPAVAPAGGTADLALVDEHDVAGRVAFLGDHRGPQSGVAAAHDAQVAVFVAHERRVRLGNVGALEPVRHGFGIGDRVERSAGVWQVVGVVLVAHGLTAPRS